jgi:DNA-binding response OmpR family regulator
VFVTAVKNDETCGVLAICPGAQDRALMREILGRNCMKLYQAATGREGAEFLWRHLPQVVICEARLPDADWKEVLGQTAQLRDGPRLIVISSQADDSLWAEVLNLGGYDLLPKPLVPEEVARVAGLAWQNWKTERGRQGKQPVSLSMRKGELR